tara:strand:+ start:394 stop:624 length:231 start_codon:yes stop_codon:yes gene_type:complete
MKKVKMFVRQARGIAKRAKKKAKPLARRILNESIKLERLMEREAKKVLVDKQKKVKKKKKTTRRKVRRKKVKRKKR